MSDFNQDEPSVTIERVGEDAPIERSPLADEFREFGRQLLRAMRSVAESDELRGLGREIVESLRNIGEEVQETLERTRGKEEVRAVGEQARRVTQSVTTNLRSGEVTSEIQTNLSQALRSLNSELNKVIDQVQSRSARISDEVDGTASEVRDGAGDAASNFSAGLDAQAAQAEATYSGMQESVEGSWGDTLERASDQSERGPEPMRGAENLEEGWNEATNPEADIWDTGGRSEDRRNDESNL